MIQATPFWRTREALGYTQLMFEVDALGSGRFLCALFMMGSIDLRFRNWRRFRKPSQSFHNGALGFSRHRQGRDERKQQ